MSSKLGRFFYWLISAILGTFFMLIGAIGVALPWFDSLKMKMISFLLEDHLILPLFGLGFLLVGLSILMYTFSNSRRRYIQIRTGQFATLINENVIQQYLDRYWRESFPLYEISSSIAIKKHAIHISANLPFLSPSEEDLFIKKVQQDLGDIFGHVLGYPYEVYLTANVSSSSS